MADPFVADGTKGQEFVLAPVDLDGLLISNPGYFGAQKEERILDRLDMGPIDDPGRMREAGHCSASLVDALWEQKGRLDSLFDAGDGPLYRRAVEELFTENCRWGSGGVLGNRAGQKFPPLAKALNDFREVFQATVEEGESKEVVFLDICGAPGGWSKYLFHLGSKENARMKGYGFSLKEGTNPLSCHWYPELRANDNFIELYGEDGTGDVSLSRNIDHTVKCLGHNVSIAVGDAGFGVGKSSQGEHLENYQEIILSRLLIGEVRLALQTMVKGGCFVCKLFDTFSHLMAETLLILAALFREVRISKPANSRIVNSERYVLAEGFRGHEAPGVQPLVDMLAHAHRQWPSEALDLWSGSAPRRIVGDSLMSSRGAAAFLGSLKVMAESLCEQQTKQLKVAVDRACELKAQGHQGLRPTKRRRRNWKELQKEEEARFAKENEKSKDPKPSSGPLEALRT